MTFKSLSIKIIVILIICILSIMTLSSILFYTLETSVNKKNVIENCLLTSKRLANNLVEPLWNFDKESVDKIVDMESRNKDVLAIFLYNDFDELLLLKHKYKKEIVTYTVETDIKLANSFFNCEDKIIKNGIEIGRVKVHFSDYFLKQSRNLLLSRIIFQLLVISLTIIAVVYITFNRIIIIPIKMLNNVVEDFSNKDFKVRATINGEDELGNLSRNFNNMADALQKYNDNLEELVKDRTNDLYKANNNLTIMNNQMKNELTMAQRIQEAMIPKAFPHDKLFSMNGVYIPMDSLGGDYYDVYNIGSNKIGIVIADVCGHGVPAALITTMAKISFRNHSMKENISTGDTLNLVNRELFEVIGNIEYLTAFFCIIDIEKNILEWTNAGHPDIFLIRNKDKNIVEMKPNATIIGFAKNIKFASSVMDIQVGDRLILYTDGIIETKNDIEELYGKKNLVAQLTKYSNYGSKELVAKIIEDVDKFRGSNNADDDITLLIIDILNSWKNLKLEMGVFSSDKKLAL